jgi:hypothetical protein
MRKEIRFGKYSAIIERTGRAASMTVYPQPENARTIAGMADNLNVIPEINVTGILPDRGKMVFTVDSMTGCSLIIQSVCDAITHTFGINRDELVVMP